MYRIESIAAKESGSTYFDRSELKTHSIQTRLRTMIRHVNHVVCLCRGEPGIPLKIRDAKTHLCLVRINDRGGHAPGCFHASSDAGAVLGFENGALIVKGDRLVFDLDWLIHQEPSASAGSGLWQGERVDLGGRLLPPLWLLNLLAGHNVHHPSHRRVPPFGSILDAAGKIGIRHGGQNVGSLADILLVAEDLALAKHAAENNRKLRLTASSSQRDALAICLLPPKTDPEISPSGRKFIRLKPQFGAPVNVDIEVLERALNRYPFARQRHARGEPVMLLGLAACTCKQGEHGNYYFGDIKQIALLPVAHGSFTPLPTIVHAVDYQAAEVAGSLFVVAPDEDPRIREAVAKRALHRPRKESIAF